jgi:hypothetical protein
MILRGWRWSWLKRPHPAFGHLLHVKNVEKGLHCDLPQCSNTKGTVNAVPSPALSLEKVAKGRMRSLPHRKLSPHNSFVNSRTNSVNPNCRRRRNRSAIKIDITCSCAALTESFTIT